MYTQSCIILLQFSTTSLTQIVNLYHSQLPSPPHIFLPLHLLCYESFYLLKQNSPIFRVPIFLPCIFRSAPMPPFMKSFVPCFPLEEQVKLIYCTEHCQAFNRMEGGMMISEVFTGDNIQK